MANPATAPEVAVADRLVAASVSVGGAAAAKGTNVFHGPELPADRDGLIPSACIFAQPYGGSRPLPYLGIDEDYREFSVQVLVRDKDYARGLATARAAHIACQRQSPSGYVTMLLRTELTPLGKDEQDHFRWVFSVDVWYKG